VVNAVAARPAHEHDRAIVEWLVAAPGRAVLRATDRRIVVAARGGGCPCSGSACVAARCILNSRRHLCWWRTAADAEIMITQEVAILSSCGKSGHAGAEREIMRASGWAGSAIHFSILHDLKARGAPNFSRFPSAVPSGLAGLMARLVTHPRVGARGSQTLWPCRKRLSIVLT